MNNKTLPDCPFIELIQQFSGYCNPADACENKQSCWTHSHWEGGEEIASLAWAATKMRQEDSWWDVSRYEGDERRCSVPAHVIVETGEEPAGSWYQISNGAKRTWAACQGELTVPAG